MLGRFRNPVVALGLLVLPVPSVHLHSMLRHVRNPVLALALFKRYESDAYVISTTAAHTVYFMYCSYWLYYALNYSRGMFGAFEDLLGMTTWPVVVMGFPVVPVLGATSVVGERRRGTLMPVRLSLLRPFDIVWGKVVASVAPVLFPAGVCAVTLVLFSLLSLMGMTNTHEIYMVGEKVYWLLVSVGAGAGLVVLSMAVSVVCVLASTLAKNSTAAVAMSYGMIPMAILVNQLVVMWPMAILTDIPCGPSSNRPCETGIYPLIRAYFLEIYCGLTTLLVLSLAAFSLAWACRRLRLPAKNAAAV